MHLELVFVLLFAIATGVALVARRFNIPYTVALVVAGIILGALNTVEPPHLTKDLLFAVFLPGLLFEAAFHIDFKKFWANKIAIHTLALPGVVLAIAATGLLLTPVVNAFHLESGFRLIDGLVFGGIIAATDPIAVVAIFKSLGAPKRLSVLVEGESLLNDGTAVVLFGVIFAIAMGEPVTAGGVVIDFVRTCGVGILVGAGIGWVGSKVIHLVDDPMIEITVTTVVAWGSFALAEQVHVSGVLATVTAGLLCGNYGAHTGMSATKIAVVSFWAYIAFALNSIVFLLIGFEVELLEVLASWKTVLIAWLAATLGRAIVIAVVSTLLRGTRERLPKGFATLLCWGGIRGGLSMVLVLALPPDFPHRQFLINIVFGVVVVSILAQGLTMAPVMRRLGVVSNRGSRLLYERARASMLGHRAALDELAALESRQVIDNSALAAWRKHHQEAFDAVASEVKSHHLGDAVLEAEERTRLERHLILVEKDRLLHAVHEGLASDEAVSSLLADLDARLVALEDYRDAPVPDPAAPATPPTPDA